MTFPKDTIRLGTARAIFIDVRFEEVMMGRDIVVGYKATIDGVVYENARLTALCTDLWMSQRGFPKQ